MKAYLAVPPLILLAILVGDMDSHIYHSLQDLARRMSMDSQDVIREQSLKGKHCHSLEFLAVLGRLETNMVVLVLWHISLHQP